MRAGLPGLTEILGLFLVVVGCCAIVGAAAFVSAALAVLAAGLFLTFGGIVVVYVASALEKPAPEKPRVTP